ncbi:GAF domain-containing protein [Desulfomonile tiedjei]|uniref:Response regulator with CheY-like receiver, AAA-type ATPase, and DNA-binding domains n=1 Tax=Desulfomonile tiedjei (strain ATCC 49306 / DSM 6799 / DCB-1) TaxID=706587 RepID=I4C0A4_DESTA|nr:GAF domain-containing protein [Desulfomonile tiedjei]AFM22995.1 response regulator with CheY-like receiver, AAA-type ATPase, and DNA-binding domains [Desulfomonile tiedjei DSM 6799]
MVKEQEKILVLDDKDIASDSVRRILESEYIVHVSNSVSDALNMLHNGGFDLLITDVRTPDAKDLKTMESVSEVDPNVSFIVITESSTVNSAVETMKSGAADYVTKPFTPDQLTDLVHRVLESRKIRLDQNFRDRRFEELKRKISSTLNLKEVLGLIVEGIVTMAKVKGATLSLLDKDREMLRVYAYSGLSKEYVDKGPLDSSKSIGESIISGKDVWVENAATDPRLQYPAEAVREGISSILSLPLIVRGIVIGCLRVYTGEVRTFSKDEIDFLHKFADQAAIAIENARSYEDVMDEYEVIKDDLWDFFDPYGYL